MVRVISVHHFVSEDVNRSCCPTPVATAVASDYDLLLVVLREESPNVQVRFLQGNCELSHRFQTIDRVESLAYSPVGKFVIALEKKDSNDAAVRAYMNWEGPRVDGAPCRPRIAGAVSPSLVEDEVHLDVVEFSPVKGCPPIAVTVCPSSGNVAIAFQPNLIIVYRYLLASGSIKKYTDFQEILHIFHSFPPKEISMVEDVIGCLSTTEFHLFKIKIRDVTDEKKLRSMSVYSFSSDSDFPRQESFDEEDDCPPSNPPKPIDARNNITLKRIQDSESSQNGHLDGYCGNVSRHRDHIDIGDTRRDVLLFHEVEEVNKEFLSVGTPKIIDQTYRSIAESSESTTIKIAVNLDKSRLDSEFEAECITHIRCQMLKSEVPHESFQNLKISPVYWRKFKVKLNENSPSSFVHPLHSKAHPHLMSFTVCFTSYNEGYLYHVPGHLRKRGRGCGVQRIATYPFTSPVRKISLEPSLMHALTETGLETYTLRSGYYTVMEAENVVESKVNACPGGDIPICLVGLRPFNGAQFLDLSEERLILLSKEQEEEPLFTITNLRLPTHFDLYKDMINLANMNKVNSPHGCSQLLCEAHIVLRTWFHLLSWKLLEAGDKREELFNKFKETKDLYNESCINLANYHVASQDEREWKLALPYYRLSEKPVFVVLDEALRARTNQDKLPPGLLYYLTDVILAPIPNENVLDSNLTDKIIDALGTMALDKLAYIVLKSSTFRSFKTQKMYDIFKNRLDKTFTPSAEEVLAFALLCVDRGTAENDASNLIKFLSNVELSEILIENHAFLLDRSKSDAAPDTFSDLAILIRDSVPDIFVEVLVSLIKSDVFRLGHILELFVGSFISHDNNGTVVLQLFLETYFVEYLDNQPANDDPDMVQALNTLIRSYLYCLSSPIRFGDRNIDSDIFGPRSLYLEMLPPFQHGGSKETLLDAESPEFWCQNSLLKLQSLLCCSIMKNNKESYDIVLKYLSMYPDTVGCLSLQIICSDNFDSIKLLSENSPDVLLSFCKERIKEENEWRFLLETLNGHLSEDPNHSHHEEWYSSMQEILNHLAQMLSLDSFMRVLPLPMQTNEDYQGYVQMCRKIQQAHQLQVLISNTGQQLLATLTL